MGIGPGRIGARARWDEFEAALAQEAVAVEAEVAAARWGGRAADGGALLTAFMARTVGRFLSVAEALLQELDTEV